MKKVGLLMCMLIFLLVACFVSPVITISATSGNSNQTALMIGDVDEDGTITVFDATCIQRFLVGIIDEKYNGTVADVDEDGSVNVFDATMIQRYLVSLPYDGRIGELITQPATEVTEPTFIVETVNAASGEENVAVNVMVKKNPGVASIALDIDYDKDKLILTGFTYNTESLGDSSTTPFSSTAKIPCLFMVNGTNDVTGDFTFATLYFAIKADASGKCPITITYDEDNVYNIAEENIAFEIINGAIMIGGDDATEPSQASSHTVVFKDHDGTVLSSQTVRDGDAAVSPDNPKRDGYVFAGWNIAFDEVKSDLKIMALYERISTVPTIVIDKVYAQPGDKSIAVTVLVKNNPGIAAIALDIIYDKEKLQLTNFTYNTDALSGSSTTPYNADAYQPCLLVVNGTRNIEGDFLLATMYFDVADGVAGTYPISFVYDEDNIYNIDEENIYFDVTSGFINVG